MKTAFFILVILHGLIHVIGFVKGFELREIKEFTQPISKPMGIAWLITCLLFLGYGLLFSFSHRYAWIVGLAAVLLSQILILFIWKDAKFGTLPNILILLVGLVSMGQYFFEKKVRQETAQLLSQVTSTTKILTEDDLKGLPEPVKKWLLRSGMVGRPRISIGKVTQKVEMKLKPDQDKWFRATAVQYSSLEIPGFIWTVDLNMYPMVYLVGRDKFADGKGEMLIKLNSLFPIVNEQGEKLDEGSLQRYLGEMVWFPSLAGSEYITWEELNDSTAKATMNYKGTTGSGTFYFDSEGDFYKFSALRFQGNTGEAKRYEWVLNVDQHQVMDGIKIPTKMSATWKLDEGDWTWLKMEITDIQYNKKVIR